MFYAFGGLIYYTAINKFFDWSTVRQKTLEKIETDAQNIYAITESIRLNAKLKIIDRNKINKVNKI